MNSRAPQRPLLGKAGSKHPLISKSLASFPDGKILFTQTFLENSLPVGIRGAGVQTILKGLRYQKSGRQRGEGPVAVFQYTLSGWGMVEKAGKSVRLDPGLALLIRVPENLSYYLPPQSPGWRFLYLTLTGSAALEVFSNLVARHGPVVPLEPRGAALGEATNLLFRARGAGFGNIYLASDLAWRFVMALATELNTPPPVAGQGPPWFLAAIQRIGERLNRSQTQGALAREVGVSREHLGRIFKERMGMTPSAYLMRVRIHKIVDLLSTGHYTLARAGQACGIPHRGTLRRSFKKVMGMGPREFLFQGLSTSTGMGVAHPGTATK